MIDDLPGFYAAVLAELAGALVRGAEDQLKRENSPDVLVSGKKATVLKWRAIG